MISNPIPIVVGGIYLSRCGNRTAPIYRTCDGLLCDGIRFFREDGRLSTPYGGVGHPDHDLVELVSMVVPAAELEQLRRAERAVLARQKWCIQHAQGLLAEEAEHLRHRMAKDRS